MNKYRKITYRFLELPHVHRLEVVQATGLSLPENLPEQEMWIAFFKQVKRNNLLTLVWEEIEKRHEDGEPDENPFR